MATTGRNLNFKAKNLPLTTIFTPPSSCRSRWTYEAQFYNSITGGILIQNAFEAPFEVECFPPSFSGYGRANASEIYSPGQCPVGYTTPAQYVASSTTTVICCLSSFSYFSTVTSINNFAVSSAILFAGCLSTLPKGNKTQVPARVNDTDLQPSTEVSGPLTMWGQPIQVAFQQKDLTLYTTSASSASSTQNVRPSLTAALPAATTTNQPIFSTYYSSAPVPPSIHTLSLGTKVGIGLSAVIGMTLLLAAAWMFCRHVRHKKANTTQDIRVSGDEKERYPPEKPKQVWGLFGMGTLPAELEANGRAELSGSSDKRRTVAELSATPKMRATWIKR